MVAASFAAVLAACTGRLSSSPGPSAAGPTPEASGPPPSGSVAPSPSPSPVPSATPADDPVALRRKVSRMLMVGFRGLAVGPDDPITVALAGGLGGVILFERDQKTGGSRNIASPHQLAALTAALRAAATAPLLVAIDQEGGQVARLGPNHGFPATRSEAAIGATGDPKVAAAAGRAMGATMAAAGIDLDLAPVVDVNVNPRNPAIGALGRSFSAHPDVVALMAAADIRGLHESGVLAAIKHFPGMGSATANSDDATVDITATWTKAELEPFATLIKSGAPDLVMSANIVDRHLDPDAPASLSPAIVDGLLRGELGWTGPVITDSLSAVAISSRFSRQETIARAIEAGNDILLFPNQGAYQPDLARLLIDDVVKLVRSGRISEARLDQSIARLDRLAAARPR